MALTRAGSGRLEVLQLQAPLPGPEEVLIRTHACGVCRTDLHLVDGDLPVTRLPLIPGHEIVGVVQQVGDRVRGFGRGDRVGVPWLASSCGVCRYCRAGRENLCPSARFTGYHAQGGYAEYVVVRADSCFALPERYDDEHAAPLLCAGLIGYRAYRMAGCGRRIGLYGFGAAAHIIAQVAAHQQREVYAFVAPGDEAALAFARRVGVTWAGTSEDAPPEPLDSALVFAPVGRLVPEALSHVAPGGVVVCAGIHMSDIPSFPYKLLWEERVVRSVANLTRADAADFLQLAAHVPLQTEVHVFPLARANDALTDLREGHVSGAAVLAV
jgi:propanol-preferring alcohol dehydrogenase